MLLGDEKITYLRRLMDPQSCTNGEVRRIMGRAARLDMNSAMSAAVGLLAVLAQQGGITEGEIADCIAAQRRVYYGQGSTSRPERTFKPGGLIIDPNLLPD